MANKIGWGEAHQNTVGFGRGSRSNSIGWGSITSWFNGTLAGNALVYIFDNASLMNAVNLWISDEAAAISQYGDASTWDVSNVTSIYGLFSSKNFTGDMSNWDVSNVVYFDYSFFNSQTVPNVANWNVSSGGTMISMFSGSQSNFDVSNWDVSNVTSMRGMFSNTPLFNSNIGQWNVSNVTDMSEMFSSAQSFNQDLGSWDVSNVSSMDDLFLDAAMTPYSSNQFIIRCYNLAQTVGVESNVSIDLGQLHCSSIEAQWLIDNKGWNISIEAVGDTDMCPIIDTQENIDFKVRVLSSGGTIEAMECLT